MPAENAKSAAEQRAGFPDCDLKSVEEPYGVQRGGRAQPEDARLVH